MAITYNTTVATNRLTQVLNALDAVSNAKLVVGTSALSGGSTGTLVTFTLAHPSASVSGRVFTTLSVPISATSSAAGVAAKAELRASDGTVIASGLTVGAAGSGADCIIDTTSIVLSRTIYLLALTITHP